MFELDVRDLSTFRNHPRPENPTFFNWKLGQLGGFTIDGRPRLRVVWGCEEKDDSFGELHIKYLAARWVKEASEHLYYNLKTGEMVGVTREEAEAKYDKDPQWLYVNKDASESVEIGMPRWIVEEFNPVSRRYEEVFYVETADGRYRPLGDDVLDEVRRRMRAAEKYRPQPIEQVYKNKIEKREAQAEKDRTELIDELSDEIRPHAHRLVGNPQVAMVQGDGKKQNKRTRFGKAK